MSEGDAFGAASSATRKPDSEHVTGLRRGWEVAINEFRYIRHPSRRALLVRV